MRLCFAIPAAALALLSGLPPASGDPSLCIHVYMPVQRDACSPDPNGETFCQKAGLFDQPPIAEVCVPNPTEPPPPPLR